MPRKSPSGGIRETSMTSGPIIRSPLVRFSVIAIVNDCVFGTMAKTRVSKTVKKRKF